MKKMIIVLFLFFFLLGPVFAKVSLGTKVSLNHYSYWGVDWEEYVNANNIEVEGALSYSFGSFLEVPINRNFKIQPEVKYTSATHRFGNSIFNWASESWSLFEIPLHIKFILHLDGGRLYGMAGPSLSILLEDIRQDQYSSTTSLLQADNKILFGMSIAAGYEMDMGDAALVLGIRYIREFSKIINNSELYSQGFGVELGIVM